MHGERGAVGWDALQCETRSIGENIGENGEGCGAAEPDLPFAPNDKEPGEELRTPATEYQAPQGKLKARPKTTK